MKKQVFWGIDISKNHLDVCLVQDGQKLVEFRVENSPSKISMAFSHHLSTQGTSWQESVFCMEHTGMYGNHLQFYLSRNTQLLYVVSPLHLKRSLGLTRGKNDRVDALRIARFIARHHQDLLPYRSAGHTLQQLRLLAAERQRLLSIKMQLTVPAKELEVFTDKKLVRASKTITAPVQLALKKAIAQIDQAIRQCIAADPNIQVQYQRICSVPGVGPVLATQFLLVTNGGTRLCDARKLACYAGVAPFEHSSGSSIRGRTRVSTLANKRLKALLHLAALSAIRFAGEMKEYYQRKKQQGKHAMSILNAIRNKIVRRVCAVVNENRSYDKNLLLS